MTEKDFLCNLKQKNVNRLITGNLSINSISNKFDQLKTIYSRKG